MRRVASPSCTRPAAILSLEAEEIRKVDSRPYSSGLREKRHTTLWWDGKSREGVQTGEGPEKETSAAIGEPLIAKRPFEVAVAIIIPPLATLLAWRNIVRRRDLAGPLRGWWAVMCLLPSLGPLLYVGIGRGQLW
jgi:hypothetical protein